MLGRLYFLTLIHNIEQELQVQGRFFKKFSGSIDLEHHSFKQDLYYYVRVFCKETELNPIKYMQFFYNFMDDFPHTLRRHEFAHTYLSLFQLKPLLDNFRQVLSENNFAFTNQTLTPQEIDFYLKKEQDQIINPNIVNAQRKLFPLFNLKTI